MRYSKLISDNESFIIEIISGNVPSNFIELSDPYLLRDIDSLNVNLISDIRSASFNNFKVSQAFNLSKKFLLEIPKEMKLNYALVIDHLKISIGDRQIVTKYVEGVNLSDRTDGRIFSSLNEVYQWMNPPKKFIAKINKELKSQTNT